MKITRERFGTTKSGKQVDIIRLSNSQGYSAGILTYGAYLHSFTAPDRNGKIQEITKNFDSFEPYLNPRNFMGATIGRYANRIAHGKFVLDGETYTLEENSAACHLHGGSGGFHTKIWEAFPMRFEDRVSVKLTIHSPDGDEGYPGAVDAAVTLTLTSKNEFMFLYEAAAEADTVISLTNHTYWNLRGSCEPGSIYDQQIRISSDRIVEVDRDLLPTGNLSPVEGTPFDLRTAQPIGEKIDQPNNGNGYDHNFLIDREQAKGSKEVVVEAAEVTDPVSGRSMIIRTNAPGIQFYSDNFSNPKHCAYCLETGELPDAMNHENFPSPILRKGELYRQVTIHSFATV